MTSGHPHPRGPVTAETFVFAETQHAVRLCHPGWETAGRLTFSAGGEDWDTWRSTVFEPVILPAFLGARAAFSAGRRKDLAAWDRDVDAALSAPHAAASRFAGARLAREYTVPGAEKTWRWYREQVTEGAVPGHVVVMSAVRSAAFHLAPRAALAALLFLEARGGLPDDTEGGWMRLAAAAAPETNFRLRAA